MHVGAVVVGLLVGVVVGVAVVGDCDGVADGMAVGEYDGGAVASQHVTGHTSRTSGCNRHSPASLYSPQSESMSDPAHDGAAVGRLVVGWDVGVEKVGDVVGEAVGK